MPPDSGRHLRVLLLTDVFPPRSGGSGWSTYYLGKALQDRGHEVSVLRPRFDHEGTRPAIRSVEYGDIAVEEVLIPQAAAWARRGGLEKAAREALGRRALAHRALVQARQRGVEVLHGGHSISGVAASLGASRASKVGMRVVSVATVRDYWPLCPVSTRLFSTGKGVTFQCPDCHRIVPYLKCVRRSTRRGSLVVPPALARWLLTLRLSRSLAKCGAVIAVSNYVRHELARSGRVPASRLRVIPNLVDLPSVGRALSGPWPLHDISPEMPFLLFAGKLDRNKGAQALPRLVCQAGVRLPVVVAGDGPLREQIAGEAARLGLDFRFYDWLDNDAVLLLMSRARSLLFPSAWQEPLSRVLLEGLASGAAIVALNTGGTPDAIANGESGWLASDLDGMVDGLRRVVSDDTLNARLRDGARRRAEERFSAPVVSAQVETLYFELLDRLEARRA